MNHHNNLSLEAGSYPEMPMNPEYNHQQPTEYMDQQQQQIPQGDQVLQAVFAILLQVTQMNQSLLNLLTANPTVNHSRVDPKVRPKPYSSLPSEDVIMWLDHFDIEAKYHQWKQALCCRMLQQLGMYNNRRK